MPAALQVKGADRLNTPKNGKDSGKDSQVVSSSVPKGRSSNTVPPQDPGNGLGNSLVVKWKRFPLSLFFF